MEKVTQVKCTRSSKQGKLLFKEGQIYEVNSNNIPVIPNQQPGTCTWNDPVREELDHLALFEAYKETPYEKCVRMFPVGSEVLSVYNSPCIIEEINQPKPSGNIFANGNKWFLYNASSNTYATLVKEPKEYPLTVKDLVKGRWYRADNWTVLDSIACFDYISDNGDCFYYNKVQLNGDYRNETNWFRIYDRSRFKEVPAPEKAVKSLDTLDIARRTYAYPTTFVDLKTDEPYEIIKGTICFRESEANNIYFYDKHSNKKYCYYNGKWASIILPKPWEEDNSIEEPIQNKYPLLKTPKKSVVKVTNTSTIKLNY